MINLLNTIVHKTFLKLHETYIKITPELHQHYKKIIPALPKKYTENYTNITLFFLTRHRFDFYFVSISWIMSTQPQMATGMNPCIHAVTYTEVPGHGGREEPVQRGQQTSNCLVIVVCTGLTQTADIIHTLTITTDYAWLITSQASRGHHQVILMEGTGIWRDCTQGLARNVVGESGISIDLNVGTNAEVSTGELPWTWVAWMKVLPNKQD